MINEKSMTNLYNVLIQQEGNELTTKQLNALGFNSKDLADLINKEVLERIKRGAYLFKSIDELFCYGKKLLTEKEYEQATSCFEKCYQLNPKHIDACLQLLFRAISKKEYESVFEYLDVLLQTENAYYMSDINFYLYLLNIITELPEKNKQYAKYLKFEDIRVDIADKRYKDVQLQNKIRTAVLQRKFPYALKQLKELIEKHDFVTLQDMIARTLIFQAVEVETISKNTILEYVKKEQYDLIVSFLENKEKRHSLSLTNNYALKLANEIITILSTEQMPQIQIFETENIFEAIDGYNYELALKLSKNYNEKNKINSSESIINLLLEKISMINLNKNIDLRVENNEEFTELTTKNEVVLTEENQSKINFSDIVGYLAKYDLENTFRALSSYLNIIDKKDYEFLILELIKISLIEKDIAFTKPMAALNYISRENFSFEISSYIQSFYLALAEDNFEEARVYLNIIAKGSKLGQECVLVDALKQMLSNTEKQLNYKQNNFIWDNVEKAFNDSKKQPVINRTNQYITTPKQKEDSTKISTNVSLVNDSEFEKLYTPTTNKQIKEIIDDKYDLLLKGRGIVLLKPYNKEDRKQIHQIAKEYGDIDSFSIGEGDKKIVVLRYKPYITEYIDLKTIISGAKQAYKEENYDLCIEKNLKLLQVGDPKAFVYASIGLCYLRKFEKDLAIDFLTVATELSKLEGSNYDFSELVLSLEGIIDEDDKKTRVKMHVEDFDRGNEMEEIENITSYILETGLDVESACKQLRLSDEEINKIRLIYAREYYSYGLYEKGDEFVKVVEQSNSKTKEISKTLTELRKNKKFYVNRAKEKNKQLSLTLKPKPNKK